MFVYPVVTVHHLKINPFGMSDTSVYCTAVAFVLLMDRPADTGIFVFIFIGDHAGIVRGTIVYDEDLNFVSSGQQCIYAVSHIFLGIITRHSKRY